MSLNDITSWLFGDWWHHAVVGIALIAPIAAFGVTEARSLRVTTDVVTSSSITRELDGTRIVFVADVHAGPLFGPERMDALVERVNALEPDVLILGGDYVGGRMSGAKVFYPRAKDFQARVAKLAVLGNHDNWEDPEGARRGLAEAGFTLLENEHTRVTSGDSSFAVAGVGDLYTSDPDPEAAAEGIDPDMFSVLVSHNPDVFADRLGSTAGDWDLALAGHTHGGQVTLFGRPLHVPSEYGRRYGRGWRTENGTPILVSNGVGAVTLPFRLFAEPEIHLITLRTSQRVAYN